MTLNQRTIWPLLVGLVGCLALGVGGPVVTAHYLEPDVWYWVSFAGWLFGAFTVFIACAQWYELVRVTRPPGRRRAATNVLHQVIGRSGFRGRSRREAREVEREQASFAYANDPMTHLHHFVNGHCDCGAAQPTGWDTPHVHHFVDEDGFCECGAHWREFAPDDLEDEQDEVDEETYR